MPDYIDADFKDARPLWRRLRPRPAHLFAHKPDIMAKDYNGGLYVPAKPFWWTKRTWREWLALALFGPFMVFLVAMFAAAVLGAVHHH